MVQIANVPEFSIALPAVKASVMLLMMLPWMWLAAWVNGDTIIEDPILARADKVKWNALTICSGLLGFLLWLVMPFYIVGMLFYLVLAGGGLLAYATYRNGKVSPERKVLTKDHLSGLLRGKGGKKGLDMEILTKVTIYDNYEKIVFPPDPTTAEEKDIRTYNHAQEFLFDIAWRRASEVVLTPAGAKSRVLFVIDGVAHERPAIPLAQAEETIQFIKEIAGLEVDEVRRPQKGKLSVDSQEINTRADMEVSSAGTTGGQRLIFRIMQEVARINLGELGMPDEILGRISSIAQTKNGLFICAGRRGSGVTSTLYSMLRQRDAFMSSIVTLEAKPAVELENITQHVYGDDDKPAKALSVAIQRGLDVLMIDKCPDSETAKALATLAAEKPVLVGMQANDTFSALAKWVKLVGDAKTAVEILRGVVCQMLVRQLCPKCKVAYKPNSARLAKLNLASADIDSFYRPPAKGDKTEDADKKETEVCPECQGSGYKGRIAVFELLKLTPEIRELIMNGATVAQIRAACRKNEMLYLQEMAMQRVIDGTTSVQEVVRVAQQQKQKQAAKK